MTDQMVGNDQYNKHQPASADECEQSLGHSKQTANLLGPADCRLHKLEDRLGHSPRLFSHCYHLLNKFFNWEAITQLFQKNGAISAVDIRKRSKFLFPSNLRIRLHSSVVLKSNIVGDSIGTINQAWSSLHKSGSWSRKCNNLESLSSKSQLSLQQYEPHCSFEILPWSMPPWKSGRYRLILPSQIRMVEPTSYNWKSTCLQQNRLAALALQASMISSPLFSWPLQPHPPPQNYLSSTDLAVGPTRITLGYQSHTSP